MPREKTTPEKRGEIFFPEIVSNNAQSTPSPLATLPTSIHLGEDQAQDSSAPVNTSSPAPPATPIHASDQPEATCENPEEENFQKMYKPSANHPVTPEDKHLRYIEALSKSPAADVHNNWVPVYAHTGKCDECDQNKHNMLQRCRSCNHHLCRTCIEGRRYKHNHWADLDELDWSPKEPNSEPKSSGKKNVGRPRKTASGKTEIGSVEKKHRGRGKAGSSTIKDTPLSFEIGVGTKSAAGSSRVTKLAGSSGPPKKRVYPRNYGLDSLVEPKEKLQYEFFEDFMSKLPESMRDPSWRQEFPPRKPFEPTRPSPLSKEQARSQPRSGDEDMVMVMVDGQLRNRHEIEGLFDDADDSDEAEQFVEKHESKAGPRPVSEPASKVAPKPRRSARETARKPANRDSVGSSRKPTPVRHQGQQLEDDDMPVPMGFPGRPFGAVGGPRQVAPPNRVGRSKSSEMNNSVGQTAHPSESAGRSDSMAMPDPFLARGDVSRRNGVHEQQQRMRFRADEAFQTMVRSNIHMRQLSPPSTSRPSAPPLPDATPSPLSRMVPSIGSAAPQGLSLAELFAQVERKHAEEEARKKDAENAAKLAALEEECRQFWNTNGVILDYRNRGKEGEAHELLKATKILMAIGRGITIPQD